MQCLLETSVNIIVTVRTLAHVPFESSLKLYGWNRNKASDADMSHINNSLTG